jgi:hypothetical protein
VSADPWADACPEIRDSPPPPPAALLRTVALSRVVPVQAVRLTTDAALPIWRAQLHALVGEGESGKTWLAGHTAADVADAGHSVLVLDGEMSASSWLRRFIALGVSDDVLARVHYCEMTDTGANVPLVKATVAQLGAQLVVWDSALSLISRTVQSENDNAGVSRVYDQLREIVRDGPAGLIVDHTARGSGSLVSRGATAKFNSLDISYGVRLAEGAVPGMHADWSSTVSVEKDRHGLLPRRLDRTAQFTPLGAGNLALEVWESGESTHRLSAGNPITVLVAHIAALSPPPKSGNEAHKLLGGRRAHVLAAFKLWSESHV